MMFDDIIRFVNTNFKNGKTMNVGKDVEIVFVGNSNERWFMCYSGKGEKRHLAFEGVIKKGKLTYLMVNDMDIFDYFVNDVAVR